MKEHILLIFIKGDTLQTNKQLEQLAQHAFTLICAKCTMPQEKRKCRPPSTVCERKTNMVRYAKSNPNDFLKEWGEKLGKG